MESTQKPMRVVFMGTPDFAVPSLAALAGRAAPGDLWPAGLELVGVFTRPDKTAGRGRQAILSPVKRYASERGLSVYQPGSLRRPEALELLRSLVPDVVVVAAFGQILPPEVLRLPAHGCLNVHASLLPRWRGAAPINAAILAGDAETGVTIMLMDAGLDTGPMLAKRATTIGPEETAGTLFDRLSALGADLLTETLPRWLRGEIVPEPQDERLVTMTRPLAKEEGRLDWRRAAAALARQVRAHEPWPGAYTTWNGQTLKVHAAHEVEPGDPAKASRVPGRCFVTRDAAGRRLLACTCGQGALALDVIQLEGRKILPSDVVLLGHPALAEALLGI